MTEPLFDYEGNPTNARRVQLAAFALRAFMGEAGVKHLRVNYDDVRDLIADLMHYAHKHGMKADQVTADAYMNFLREVQQ